jgi:acetoin utilization deacetylase AcuC-like enzyme
MIVYFHPDFYQEYTSDPAAEGGRMEAIVEAISPVAAWADCQPAAHRDILAAHRPTHVDWVRRRGLYDIAARAAGGAVQAALTALKEPCFGLIRPPGHHASASSCWGFCYFNNMAISLLRLKRDRHIDQAFVLDFDLHYGDGNVNILKAEPWVTILNPESTSRSTYLDEVKTALDDCDADMIAVSAGFDHHINDWGGLLHTTDYQTMGTWVRETAERNSGGCYGILEGGYNHNVLGSNVLAFIKGLDGR